MFLSIVSEIERELVCITGSYSDNFIIAFFEKIGCGDYTPLYRLLMFTIVFSIFTLIYAKYVKDDERK